MTRVSAVEIEEGKYCYAFECTVTFEGIPFDSVPYGTMVVGGGYEWPVRMEYMAVTDDVDAVDGEIVRGFTTRMGEREEETGTLA